jgi:hypothetical protein
MGQKQSGVESFSDFCAKIILLPANGQMTQAEE